MIIDAHTHFFPPELGRDPRAWARERGEPYWVDLVAPLNHKSIQGWADPQTILRDMDAAGVDQAVLLGWYWQRQETCRWHNQESAQLLKNHPDRFHAFAACNASTPPESVLLVLQEAESMGFSGIGELLPPVQGHDFDAPGMQALLEFAESRNWPINLHVTEPVGHPYPGRQPTPLEPLAELAADNPRNTFIFAHLGGLLPFYALNPKVAHALGNVFYDTAACPLLYDLKAITLAAKVVGHEKILWGTDYPLRIFPASQKVPDFKTFLQLLKEDEDLAPSALQAILGQNVQRLLKKKPAPEGAGF